MKANNIYREIPQDLSEEVFEELASGGGVCIERIVSKGHRSPATGWYEQDRSEWVMVLRGAATLTFSDGESKQLSEGDFVNIPAYRKHKVDWTTPDRETVWLAVHYPG